ncbi:hypothetical protein GHT06_011090 [Daphnia sinensis]|uniref:Fucosyltransferase n=1 Tax=Daphnia sinensis TaxID=1820382 RepID=A0AAD5PXH8_9CRUS|nr:hypothetical protein GHT06_011090 [Daphnia sinensis]
MPLNTNQLIRPSFSKDKSQNEAVNPMLSTGIVNRLLSLNKRRLRKTIHRAIVLAMSLFVLYQCANHDLNPKTNVSQVKQKRDVKSILIWNAPERAEVVAFAGHFLSCPIKECRMDLASGNASLDDYDAIVINFNDQYPLPGIPNSRRLPHQRFIFFTQEPPPALKEYDFHQYDGYFNWTMTYRKDSDILFSYGRIRKRTTSFVSKTSVNKTKLVAWMATQCKTDGRRESYIQQLRNYIDIDVYGLCGRLSCARHPIDVSHPRCYDMLESTYKFYLSFENSICRDYVTEKFFKILERRIVPVVYGGADYRSIAPAGSYIDARLYSPAQLAEYLMRIDANDTLLLRRSWCDGHGRRGFCDLCSRLHLDNTEKSYDDLASLWQHPGRECKSPMTLS